MSRENVYKLNDYGQMLVEGPRRNAYVEALRRTITPGCSVLDIGTGPGFFAMLAVQLGAAKVYALEPDDSIEAARACAADNAGADRIHWIRELSTKIDLPERVDVVLGDLRGTLPTFDHNIESMIDARRRHLKPGGTLLSQRDVLRVAPVQFAGFSRVFDVWSEPVLGVDLRAGRRFISNDWWRTDEDPEILLAPAADLAVIDYMTADNGDVSGKVELVVDRPGVLHGWLLWFDAHVTEGVSFSNAPDQPLLVYGRAFFPVESPRGLVAGDRLSFSFRSKPVAGKEVIRWITSIDTLAGDSTRYDQSTFKSKPRAAGPLARRAEDFVPSLGSEGRADLAILDLMQQSLTLGEIATHVASEFPQRFPRRADALAHVSALSGIYAEGAPAADT